MGVVSVAQMNDDGWEERMAARAAIRRNLQELMNRKVEQRISAWLALREWSNAQEYFDTMTLDDAIHILSCSVPCACMGGMLCCMNKAAHAQKLVDTAQIIAEMMSRAKR